jgi:acyl carrier protein
MVPSALVLLPRLPLTRHGKVDRQALPAPESSSADHFAPRSEMERTIAHVWSEALNVESVGIDQNFFDLGGHSLLMVKVHRRLKETLNCELSLMDMFKYPTINSLAQHVNGESDEKSFQHIHERLQKRDAARKQRQSNLDTVSGAPVSDPDPKSIAISN